MRLMFTIYLEGGTRFILPAGRDRSGQTPVLNERKGCSKADDANCEGVVNAEWGYLARSSRRCVYST